MKAKRQSLIRVIVEIQSIQTQEELAEALRVHGMVVTQATVSRDIKEMHLIKVLAEDGVYRYAMIDKNDQGVGDRLIRMLSDSVVDINSANNLIVPAAFYPMKLIAVLFNSGLYQLLFQSRFNTHKVLRSDLEQLPLPDFPAPVRAELSGLADRLLAGDASAISRVDVVRASVLGLTAAEKVRVTEL